MNSDLGTKSQGQSLQIRKTWSRGMLSSHTQRSNIFTDESAWMTFPPCNWGLGRIQRFCQNDGRAMSEHKVCPFHTYIECHDMHMQGAELTIQHFYNSPPHHIPPKLSCSSQVDHKFVTATLWTRQPWSLIWSAPSPRRNNSNSKSFIVCSILRF